MVDHSNWEAPAGPTVSQDALQPLDLPDPAPAPLPVTKQDHLLSNELYDVIKFLAQILFPAAGTLYFAMSGIWGLPSAEQVIGSITAVDIFLGGLLSISKTSFDNSDAKFGGTINVIDEKDKKTFSLTLNGDPNDLDTQKQVTFKINPS